MKKTEIEEKPWTISSLLDWTAEYFERNGISQGRLDAEILLAHVLSEKRLNLNLNINRVVQEDKLSEFRALIKQRRHRMPLAYILGETEFMGIDFKVSRETLIPRPETELLVEECLELINDNKINAMCDMCTGSGNIPVSIAKLSKIGSIYAADISIGALETAQENIDRHGLAARIILKHGDMFKALNAEPGALKFDLITSNPPYVSEKEMQSIEPELLFEPRMALYGGLDGLEFYKILADGAYSYLSTDGYLAVEMSSTKPEEIIGLFESTGYRVSKIIKDYSGHNRVLILNHKE